MRLAHWCFAFSGNVIFKAFSSSRYQNISVMVFLHFWWDPLAKFSLWIFMTVDAVACMVSCTSAAFSGTFLHFPYWISSCLSCELLSIIFFIWWNAEGWKDGIHVFQERIYRCLFFVMQFFRHHRWRLFALSLSSLVGLFVECAVWPFQTSLRYFLYLSCKCFFMDGSEKPQFVYVYGAFYGAFNSLASWLFSR